MNEFFATGRCTCGDIHYTMGSRPLFVHCCHCSWCQRETGSAFAVNALLETTRLHVSKGVVEKVAAPSNSGAGQDIVRCPNCQIALWSHYGAAKERVAFVRVGTLENPDLCPPDIHIFAGYRQSWIELGDSAPVVDEYYRRSELWPEDSLKRYRLALEL